MKILFWSRSKLIVSFADGVFAGQTILWCGEGLGNGDFALVKFGATKIHPVTEENFICGNVMTRGIREIRKLDESEHLALIQILKEYKWHSKFIFEDH